MKTLNFGLILVFLIFPILFQNTPARNNTNADIKTVKTKYRQTESKKQCQFNGVPIPILNYKLAKDGITFQMKVGKMKVNVCRDDIIHVIYTPSKSFPTRKSLMDVKKNWKKVNWKFQKTKSHLIITTAKIKLQISLQNGALSYYNKEGIPVLREFPGGGKIMIPAEVVGESTYHAENIFTSQKDDSYYGLGQHQDGIINYKGHKVILTQNNTIISIPFFVSNKGYGVLWDNYSESVFKSDTSANISSLWSEVADAINYYFIYGPDVDQIIDGYRIITGKVPMFGKWAYGFWQSKERYKTQSELLDIIKEYRSRKIPIDNIVQDWQWWDKIGSHQFDIKRYPDPEKMINEIHKKYNAHIMISVWPKFSRKTKNYKELIKKGHVFGYGKRLPFYDPFNKEARLIYWDQINKNLFPKGIDAWWLDGTEPELMFPIVPDTIKRVMNNSLGTGARYLNAYSLMTCKSVYEGQRKITANKRVFILTRSAYAGQQRYAAASWSGDIDATWQVFKNQISAGLNFCVSGIPYWTTDIGGFFVKNYPGGCINEEYRELFVRWFQYGSFCPIFRVHGTSTPRELWRFGPKAEKILTEYDNLRYRLMPYIYSLAWQVTSKGYTIMRPLVMDFRGDPRALNIVDQFMFGPAFLVNPVTKQKVETRKLYLPKAAGWYDFWTGKYYSGGKSVEASAPINKMPLYIKAGSIVPMGPFVQYAAEKAANPIELRIYRGADAKFTIYEDENDNYNYEKGIYSTIQINWNEKKHILEIGTRKGSFPGMLKNRKFYIVWISDGHGIGINSTQNPDQVIYYIGKSVKIKCTRN